MTCWTKSDVAVVGQSPQTVERLLGRLAHGDHAHHDAAGAQPPGHRPGIDPADACDLLFPEEVVQRFGAQRVAGGRRVLTHREPRDLDPARLEVALVDPVVADEGVGGYHDLSGERRVGQHLLVACHGGAEDDLAVGRRLGAKGETLVYGAVFEYQVGGSWGPVSHQWFLRQAPAPAQYVDQAESSSRPRTPLASVRLAFLGESPILQRSIGT